MALGSPEADTSPEILAAQVPSDLAGLRFDAALARLFPEYSRSRLQAWLKEGRVLVDGRPADPRAKAGGGEHVAVTPGFVAETASHAAEEIPLNLLHEDQDLLVIDKPVGLVVHPGSGNWSGTLMNALLHHVPALEQLPRAGIVHRLDKDTSGLLVVAKTLAAQTSLVRQLQAREVSRRYLALARGLVARDGLVDAPLGRHPSRRTHMAIVPGGREARTHYALRERFERATLLECRLETGRTHQIRVHMASIGHPLVGDKTYGRGPTGDPRLDAFERQALHAWRLALCHPRTGEEMGWEAPLPADFSCLLESLRA